MRRSHAARSDPIITIQQVAERAGVSVSTVSHVINGTRYVSPELTERVRAAMAELRFQPNALARSLRRKETLTLGMIVPDNANPFFAMLAYAVENACYQRGYSLILTNSGGDLARELANINVLLGKQVDGLILAAVGLGSRDLEQVLRAAPAVVVDRNLPGVEVDTLLVDNLGGGRQATRYLIELGHRRIGCITGPSTTTPSAERVTGYRAALAEAGIPVDENLIARGDFQFAGGYAGAQALLALSEPPTAIFACNDLMAMGAIAAAAANGLRVPADLSIIGFDNSTLAAYTTPALTTVAQPIAEIGRLATEMVIQRSQTPDAARQRRILSTQLVVRQSTCPPAAPQPA
ncbi:MAG: LacI family DNA-binding transcriptional regulator [Anaerolineae bacterium]